MPKLDNLIISENNLITRMAARARELSDTIITELDVQLGSKGYPFKTISRMSRGQIIEILLLKEFKKYE